MGWQWQSSDRPPVCPARLRRGRRTSAGDYLQYTLPVTALSNSSVLEFEAQDPDTPGFGPNTVHLDDVSVVSAAVPEASSLGLLGLGLSGLAVLARKRRRA